MHISISNIKRMGMSQFCKETRKNAINKKNMYNVMS
jgi:hypothetical protein